MHFTAVYTFIAVCVLACAPALAANGSPAATAAIPPLSAADQQFLVARDAARAGDRAKLAQLAPQLTNHPLVAYVEYWQLVPRLRSADPVVVTEVESFFTRHADTYIADRLRLDWSLVLADRGDFTSFEREAEPTGLEHRRFAVALLWRACTLSQFVRLADRCRRA